MRNIIKKLIKNILMIVSPKFLNFLKSFREFLANRNKKQKYNEFDWDFVLKKKIIKLNLGSGPIKGRNGWITVDQDNADINWDLTKKIPIPDNLVDKIYSSHLLEHMYYFEMQLFLAECLRILKPGGEFSVCVPNAGKYLRHYLAKKNFIPKSKFWKPGLIDTGSYIDQVNYMAYMRTEHKYMFDEENIINTLLCNGFQEANLRKFDKSLDMPERDFESVYASAIK